MKNILRSALAMLCLLFFTINAHTQALYLKLVPNPDNGPGYQGSPIQYNNNLYFTYRNASGATQLAEYDGNTVTPIANPVSGGVQAAMIVYKNLLYLLYYNRTAGVYQLATYDGTNMVLIANPDASTSPFSYVIEYDNKLCFEYNAVQVATYDGTAWKLFSPPSAGSFTFQGGLTIYNNNLYVGFQTTGNVRQMMRFNDTALTFIPNPDGATAFSPFGGGYQGYPIIYNNKLYIRYVAVTGITQLAQYNDTVLTLIPNPDASPYGYGYGSGGFPVVYDSSLFIQYLNAARVTQLAKYNDTSFTLVPNPDAGSGYQGAPIVYNGNLYIQYQDAASVYRLGRYNDTALTLIANPDNSPYGYANYTSTGADITPPIVYGRAFNVALNKYNLYIQYEDSAGNNLLAQYNDTALTLVHNPDSSKYYQTGYRGSATIYNGLLYVQYYSGTSASYLAYLNDSSTSLPVTLLNFTVQPKGAADNLLQWQTATEVNSSYFNVQRSTTAFNFITIGKVAAAGNSSTLLNYAYNDELAAADIAPVIYYRLQEVDKDGRINYSKILQVREADGEGGFIVAPNPVADNINIQAGASADNAVVTLTDMGGKVLYSATQNITTGQNISIAAGYLSKGMYMVTIKTGTKNYTLKVIKGE